MHGGLGSKSQHIISPEPHRDHVDCTEETSLCQEANKFSWTDSVTRSGYKCVRELPEACGWLSREPHWGENDQQVTVCLVLIQQICSHFQTTSNKFITEPNLMIVNVKCNVEKDKLFHCLWECPRIIDLWKDVLDILSKIVSEKLPIFPKFPKSHKCSILEKKTRQTKC